jgi:hypothetical protein
MTEVKLNVNLKEIGLKVVQSVSYIMGSALIAYNITAFTIDKHGSYYFRNLNQKWLAIGVGIFALGLIIKNWKKL